MNMEEQAVEVLTETITPHGHDDDYDVEVLKPQDTEPLVRKEFDKREFWFTITSNTLFIISSALYLWIAVIDVQWEAAIEGVPDDVLTTNNYDLYYNTWGLTDDYVFMTPRTKKWISAYVIIYFWAAIGFVSIGVLEFIQYKRCFGIFFILAGTFGVLAAIYVEENEPLSDTFSLVSVNLFLLEAVQVLVQRNEFQGHKHSYRVADIFFLTGSCMDAVLVWLYYFVIDWNHGTAIWGVFNACLWLISALIYTGGTIIGVKHGGFMRDVESSSDSETDSKTGSNKYLHEDTFEETGSSLVEV